MKQYRFTIWGVIQAYSKKEANTELNLMMNQKKFTTYAMEMKDSTYKDVFNIHNKPKEDIIEVTEWKFPMNDEKELEAVIELNGSKFKGTLQAVQNG